MPATSLKLSGADYGTAEHAHRYSRVARLMPLAEWDAHYELVASIEALKRKRNAVVLVHNYQRPEIFHGVADVQGDSLALARWAARSDAAVIVMCGVHFMAETAKLLAPDRIVLLPHAQAGCSLALKILLAISVLGHFATAMTWMLRGRMTLRRSRIIHISVFLHMIGIVLLAKGMFHWGAFFG